MQLAVSSSCSCSCCCSSLLTLGVRSRHSLITKGIGQAFIIQQGTIGILHYIDTPFKTFSWEPKPLNIHKRGGSSTCPAAESCFLSPRSLSWEKPSSNTKRASSSPCISLFLISPRALAQAQDRSIMLLPGAMGRWRAGRSNLRVIKFDF